jgi:glutathione S-transferase
MTITLYELLGADDRRFSPFCWRTRMALAHKELDPEIVPCRFSEKHRFAFAGYDRMPVIADGDRVVTDSWDIAVYLDHAYPDRPTLFGGAIGRAEARFFNEWAPTLQGPILRMILKDIHDHLDPGEQPYFRESREKRFGGTLEQFHAGRESARPAFDAACDQLRAVLAHQPFFGGDSPAYADYIFFGGFQFARCMSPLRLLEPGDALYDWRGRLLDMYGGMARNAPGYPA